MDDLGSGSYTSGDGQTEGTGQVNPSWSEFFSVVPQEYHEKVTPVLKSWEDRRAEELTKVQSEWEDWKQFKDKRFTPEDVNWGLTLAQSLAQDPRKLWETVGSHYNFTSTPDSDEDSADSTADADPYALKFKEFESKLDQVAQAIVASHRTDQLKQAEMELDKELNAARNKHGDFDEEYVVTMMQTGMTADNAAAKYKALVESAAKQFKPPPPMMLGGGGGGVPGSGQPDPRKMTPQERRKLTVDILNAANAQNNQ